MQQKSFEKSWNTVGKALMIGLVALTLSACMASDGPDGGVMGELPARALRSLADRPKVTGRILGDEIVVVVCDPYGLDSCSVKPLTAKAGGTLRFPKNLRGADYLISLTLESTSLSDQVIAYRFTEQYRSDYPNAELKDFSGRLTVDPAKPAEIRYESMRIFVMSAQTREKVLAGIR